MRAEVDLPPGQATQPTPLAGGTETKPAHLWHLTVSRSDTWATQGTKQARTSPSGDSGAGRTLQRKWKDERCCEGQAEAGVPHSATWTSAAEQRHAGELEADRFSAWPTSARFLNLSQASVCILQNPVLPRTRLSNFSKKPQLSGLTQLIVPHCPKNFCARIMIGLLGDRLVGQEPGQLPRLQG